MHQFIAIYALISCGLYITQPQQGLDGLEPTGCWFVGGYSRITCAGVRQEIAGWINLTSGGRFAGSGLSVMVL